jgi:hypothetical protein
MTGCLTDKAAWPTHEEAMAVLLKIVNNPRTKVVPSRVYLCPWCEQYHLSSKEHKPKGKL